MRFALALLIATAAACGGSDGNGDGTFVPDAGGPSSSGSNGVGSSGAPGGSSGTPDGGSSGVPDGGPDTDGGSSGGSSGSSSGGSSGLPPECGEGAEPGADLGVLLDLGTPAPSFVTVSADGLTAAWTTDVAGSVTVNVADRADLQAAFGAPTAVPGTWANDRVALGRDGLVLAALRADRYGFDAFERAARGDAFAAAAQSPFGNVNQEGEGLAAAGQAYGDPLYTSGQTYFVYSQYGGGATSTLKLGSRVVGTTYSGGTPFTDAVFLDAVGADRRRPVALTDDQRTLFYYDEVDDLAYVTSRDDQGGPFAPPTSLGAKLDARPVAGCGALVYRDPATPSQLRAVAYQ